MAWSSLVNICKIIIFSAELHKKKMKRFYVTYDILVSLLTFFVLYCRKGFWNMFILQKQISMPSLPLSERTATGGILNENSNELAVEEARFLAGLKHKYGVAEFIPGLEQSLLDLHRLRGRHGGASAENAAVRAERARLLQSGENAFTRAARNKSTPANAIADSFRVFYLEIETDEISVTEHIILGRIAFTIQFRLTMDYSSLSAENKRFNDTVLVQLAGEYIEFLQLLIIPPEAREWARQQRSLNNNVYNDTINSYITRIIELSAEIADFIREKNIQEEKETQLLEKRREELAGFKLPPALRQAIADLLGLKPEDLDPAVARRAAQEVSVP
jgi:hypothetical protein